MYYWWIFFVLTWVWDKEKIWVPFRNPMSYTCILYLLVLLFEVWFLSRSQMHEKTKNHLFLHSNLVTCNSTVSSTRKARIWNVMMIYQPWVFQLRWKVMFTLLTHTLFNSWWVWAYNILNVVFPKISVVILSAIHFL